MRASMLAICMLPLLANPVPAGEQIRFFADDQQYARFDTDVAGEGKDNPFRRPHYLLLNLALGGSWGGEVDDDVLPQRYEIDYVRVYEPGESG